MQEKNIRLSIALAAAVSASACMVPPSMLPDDTYVTGFGNARTPREFWMRQIEWAGKEEKFDVTSLPLTYRECIADELVDLSPPAVSSGVERFVRTGLYKDYYPLVDEIKSFASDFKRKRGIELIPYAGAVCDGKGTAYPDGDTYQEMFENAMSIKWSAEGHPRSEYPKYFDCIVKATMDTFTQSELSELNAIAKNRTNMERMETIAKARDARFGGSSDAQVLGKCEAFKKS